MGNIVKVYTRLCGGLESFLLPENKLRSQTAEPKIQRVDKGRANYCRAFADAKWGSLQNYDITIRCDKYGIDGTAAILADLAKPEMAKLS